VVVAISPWVFPGFAGLGQLSQTSDRLTSCGFADWQSRPSSATGAGGFEVLIANCKLEEKRREERRERKIRKKVKRFGKLGTKKLGFPRIREDTRAERFFY